MYFVFWIYYITKRVVFYFFGYYITKRVYLCILYFWIRTRSSIQVYLALPLECQLSSVSKSSSAPSKRCNFNPFIQFKSFIISKSKFMSSTEEVNHLRIPLQELSDATNAFSEENLVAKGGFGKVYKGVSVKHGNIAIKMLYLWEGPGKGQGDPEFKTEIALLSVYKSIHIQSIKLYIHSTKKQLIYQYIFTKTNTFSLSFSIK
ncbi:putative non-specific serine/threonine protein kinase [Helianthus annuus]|uniref:non-specific serine/threonine protein kinase n=1 Tax=Helianthus annuus TaxID=4232 RepID=A0A9K3IBW6_HELAN|nr:putative non-specific serine/threonine protein kinase [Helianthus annuus]KAJ0545201.1 putative non-specific serine/threonine protein kinase [Helianthus annuus]KAJ0900251.1 putative non-specific serine/threonine protein kinase [Helianthus annuus]